MTEHPIDEEARPITGAGTPSVLDTATAQRLDHRIRLLVSSIGDSLTKLYELVEQAKAGSVHVTLGYPSWTAYVADACKIEIKIDRNKRRELVGWLSDEGMSQRAIAQVVGVDQKTVSNDLRVGEENSSPQPEGNPLAEIVDAILEDARRQGDTSSENISSITADLFRGQAEKPSITTLAGITFPRQRQQDRAPRRRPIADDFLHEIVKWHPRITRIGQLGADDRVPRNRESLARYRSDLIRFRGVLNEVIDQLGGDQ